jgi:hypothetical protein
VAELVKRQQRHQHQVLNQAVGQVAVHPANLAAPPAPVEPEAKMELPSPAEFAILEDSLIK